MAEDREADGTTFRVEGDGEPIIFIHGVGMNKDVWAPQMAAFVKTHRVVVYDMLGHGGSRLPPPEPTLDDYALQLSRLLDALDIQRANVVGHSMGSLVALAFALAQPTRVQRLAALNAVYERTPEQRTAIVARADALSGASPSMGLDDTLARWFGQPKDARAFEQAQQVRQWLSAVDPIGYARTYRLFATSDRTFVGKLQHLTMPALFLTGEHDLNSLPQMSKRLAKGALNATAKVITNARHMMNFTSPEQVNPILKDFLTSPAADRRPEAGL